MASSDSNKSKNELIEELDCFNNGGVYEEGYCITGVCSDNIESPCNDEGVSMCDDPSTATCVIPGSDMNICDEVPLESYAFPELDFDPPGFAASSKDCNNATRSDCTVVGDGEQDCSGGDKSMSVESCPIVFPSPTPTPKPMI